LALAALARNTQRACSSIFSGDCLRAVRLTSPAQLAAGARRLIEGEHAGARGLQHCAAGALLMLERHNNQYSYHSRNEWYALASDQACPRAVMTGVKLLEPKARELHACEMLGFDQDTLATKRQDTLGQTVLPLGGTRCSPSPVS
jgi:hypothetical protein